MSEIIYRQGRLFKINEQLLPKEANKLEVKNAIYLAIFEEFQGASISEKYKNLTVQDRLAQVNIFVTAWLNKQGFK